LYGDHCEKEDREKDEFFHVFWVMGDR
jgi:hypothetical protein